MSGGGAVLVVVQAQRAPRPGDLLLACDQVVLVGVDPGLVGLDGLDGASREAAELVGVEPLRLLDQAGLDGATLVSRLTPSGSCSAARTITAAWAGESSPASRAAAVASWPVCRSRGESDVTGGGCPGGAGLPGGPGVGVGEPRVGSDPGSVRGGEDLELVGGQSVDGPVDLRYPSSVSGHRCTGWRAAGRSGRAAPRRGRPRCRAGSRGVRCSWVNSLAHRCANQEAN